MTDSLEQVKPAKPSDLVTLPIYVLRRIERAQFRFGDRTTDQETGDIWQNVTVYVTSIQRGKSITTPMHRRARIRQGHEGRILSKEAVQEGLRESMRQQARDAIANQSLVKAAASVSRGEAVSRAHGAE